MRTARRISQVTLALVTLSLLLSGAVGCQPEGEEEHTVDEMPTLAPVTLGAGEKLQVVSTTSIVADVVRNVGGDQIELTQLIPLGTDPHTFEPIPQDVAAVSDAHVVFVHGAGLEIFLDDLLESAGDAAPAVPVTPGVDLLAFGEEEHEEDDHDHGGADPHTWFDPNNVIIWVDNIEQALSTLDPDNAQVYAENATAYQNELEALDRWIRDQVDQVPPARRRLVTDHTAFTYFCAAYGFEQIGAVVPAYSTLAEPSAQELATLVEAIEEYDVRAIFVGNTVSPDLAEQVAADTGTQLVFLYTGSLSEAGGPADDYISFMEYDVSAIVEALR
jgi:ABC-type Zn uptake system ZnuABC Zn-binding protein ZnuA